MTSGISNNEIEQIVKTVVNEVKPSMSDIGLEFAKELIDGVCQEAAKIGVKAVVAIANRGANPVAVHCMDDSYIASYDIAFNKAYTVVALKMPTKELKKLAQPGADLYGIQFTNNGRIVIFGGGEPLVVNGKVIGGLGVSGGSEEQDTYLAEFGENLFKEAIEKYERK